MAPLAAAHSRDFRPAWFSSHPLEEDRIAATEALIAQIDPAILATLTMDTRNFQLFKQRVASLPPPPPMQ